MQKTIKGILINPKDKTVTQVNVLNTLQGIYDTMGVDMIEALPETGLIGNVMYCDENGRLKSEQHAFIWLGGTQQVVVGNCLVLGCDNDGNDLNTSLSISLVAQRIDWL